MAGLGGTPVWRHGIVVAAVAGGAVLTGAGVIGSPSRDERFESKQVVVAPAGDDGVRITETVDIDFGSEERRGYQRQIPVNFGVPIDVEASSPDAPDGVDVEVIGGEARIRVGDPDVTLTGQHRYVLAYTLPDARLSSGDLALNIIDNEETLETQRFEVVVTGMQLDDVLCNVGAFGAEGGCELRSVADGTYRAAISPLAAGDGITVGATIVELTVPANVVAPQLPPREVDDDRLPVAISMVPLGLASGGAVFLWSRRRGRNEVFAGGAADAAYGTTTSRPPPSGMPLPPPSTATPLPAPRSNPPTTTTTKGGEARAVRLVTDDKLADLATIEFVPPTGIQPWQGAVLLGERIDDENVGAWFSGLAAREVLTFEREGHEPGAGDVVLRGGPRYDTASPDERTVLDPLFAGRESITLDSYDKQFAAAWREVRALEARSIAASGWWSSDPPKATAGGPSLILFVVLGIWVLIGAGSVLGAILGVFSSPLGAILFGIVLPAVAALAAYRTLLRVRSATGSALALRTESFRRFLAASEGRHVEWAWTHGLVREYSAWAVALGAASAWERALQASSVPPVEYVNGPLLVYSMGPSFSSAHTAPSSSGSAGSSGGFTGGSVGGGGGGGSSGSW
ncbi:MAG: DUF2207 family protein [Ilumatobacteraceae bacterium]